MRTILSFVHFNYLSHQPRQRTRLPGLARTGLIVLVVTAAAIFASSGKARIKQAPAAPMPNLRGGAATEYLKQKGLYSSLGEAVEAARLEAAGGDVRIVVDDCGASYPMTIDPTFTEIKKLTPSDGGGGKLFGGSVAIYGDTAIVGAPGEVTNVSYPGSAYIFERNQGGANNWGEVKKLTASDGDGNDFFGCSVAIYASTAIVGANGAGEPFNIRLGAAYIFDRNHGGANNWGEIKKLTASDAAELDFFGDSVAIYADTAIVGAFGDDIDILNGSFHHQGSAYIFGRNQGGANNWGEVKKLTASDGEADDSFGVSVAIYGDTAIVGADEDTIGSNLVQGSAYIFERNQGGANDWGEVKKLTASDGAQADIFGVSVAIDGDRAVVGGRADTIGSNFQQGSAYIFKRNQGGGANWGEVKKLTASDGAAPDGFGASVTIYADTAIVGTYVANSAYIFSENSPPAISAAPVTRVEGAPTSNSTIATVSDPDQAANTLAVTVNGSTNATVNGVTVSNITVSAAGEVKADVGAACGASNAGFTLRVTDSGGLFAEATLNVTVTPENVPPTIKLLPSIQL